MNTNQTTFSEISQLVLKAVSLGMGVSAAVLSFLGAVDGDTMFTLLSIGLACLALSSLNENEKEQ